MGDYQDYEWVEYSGELVELEASDPRDAEPFFEYREDPVSDAV